MINASKLLKTGVNLLSDNAPALLTAFGAVGLVGTAVLTGKASFEAAQKITDAEFVRKQEDGFDAEPFTKAEKVKLVWPLYIGAVFSGALSCGAIVMSHRISSKRAAVLAAAYALNQDRLEEYQEQIKEKFGVKKEAEARNELSQKKINRDYEGSEVLLDEGDNKVLIREDYTGRFFWSTVEEVNRAVNEVNAQLNRSKDRAIRMSDFHRRLGLSNVSLSDCMGWTVDEPLEIEWGTCTTPDGTQAVHTFEYSNRPIMDPEREAAFR
jgi:hypothetical protein